MSSDRSLHIFTPTLFPMRVEVKNTNRRQSTPTTPLSTFPDVPPVIVHRPGLGVNTIWLMNAAPGFTVYTVNGP